MNAYEQKLSTYIQSHQVQAELLIFEQSCHSVAEAAQAVQASAQDFVKNICMITADGQLVVAIVKGEDKVSAEKVGNLLKLPTPRMAKPDEILQRTGYPCGGTPSFGYPAVFLVDEHALQKDFVYTGGGSEQALVRVGVQELLRANQARVVDIHK
jgi:prolyl-tRNA editing enzyme YbaK/EbsC (Cys-tRNA(Pro) deacylase)